MQCCNEFISLVISGQFEDAELQQSLPRSLEIVIYEGRIRSENPVNQDITRLGYILQINRFQMEVCTSII